MKNGPYILCLAPEGYPGKKYREKYCYEHHLVWWQSHKTVPDTTQCVHHKNENKHDNRIENLELISKSAHSKHHAKTSDPVEYTCKQCHTRFSKKKHGKVHSFCSLKCVGLYNFPAKAKNGSIVQRLE